MRRHLFYFGVIFLLLIITAAAPYSVRAEGDPPPPPEPVKPPWITGINPNASLSTAEQEEFSPAGIISYSQRVDVPLMVTSPEFVYLEPQVVMDPVPAVYSLAVPQRFQDPADVTCGAAALGMALEFLSFNGEGEAPSQESLINELKNAGLLYDTGTGVEELAYLARQNGYQGTTAFHDWTMDQLGEQLAQGRPVVVSLGANGEGQSGHFVTLTGISRDGQWVSYNDPILGSQTISADDFSQLWSRQGNAGLVVQKEALPSSVDPMLPWIGLFSAMAMLAVTAKQYPLGGQITDAVADFRGLLSSPSRNGLGGKLIAEDGRSAAPDGYKWVPTTVPVYGWKDVTIIEKVEVPNLVKTWAVVRVDRWIEKVPVYKNVKIDHGHWAYRTVTKYRTERYRTTERYKVKKTYWYRKNGRLCQGSYYVWKTRTVVKTRKVPYKKQEKYWVPKIVTEQRLDYYRKVEHRDPIYGWRMEKKGTKIIEQPKTTRAWAPVSTKTEWKLKKDPIPAATPTPDPPPPPPLPTSPPFTPVPSQAPEAPVFGTPYPAISEPDIISPGALPGIISSGLKWYKKIDGISNASKIIYNPLNSGNFSVLAPYAVAGEKLSARLDQFIPGTYYSPGVLAKTTATSLLKKWSNGLGLSMAIPILTNSYDYGLGDHSDIGLDSPEFAASTYVDIAKAGLIGVASAAIVALATIGLVGLGVVAAVPLGVAAAVTVGVGVGLNFLIDQTLDMDQVKQDVVKGFSTFPGIWENGKLIASTGVEKVEEAAMNTADQIVNTAEESARVTIDAVIEATDSIIDVVGGIE